MTTTLKNIVQQQQTHYLHPKLFHDIHYVCVARRSDQSENAAEKKRGNAASFANPFWNQAFCADCKQLKNCTETPNGVHYCEHCQVNLHHSGPIEINY